ERSRLDDLRSWGSILATTARYLTPTVALGPFARERAVRTNVKWAETVLARLGIDVEAQRRAPPPSRGALYVHLNQHAVLAPALYAVALPHVPCVINIEYAALPLVGWASMALGSVPIVRQYPRQAKRALRQVTGRLRAGESFGISIEGLRTTDG